MSDPRVEGSGSFRTYLQETLIARCRANPAYSLRAFAKQLGLEPSYLSKLLSGKRNVTEKIILKVAGKLALGPVEVESYVNHARVSKRRGRGAVELQSFQNLAVDHFRMIADWYHYAILEVLSFARFESDPEWIAKKLGISKFEAQSAIERLERLEMIGRAADGRLENRAGNHTTVGNEFTATAFRRLQKQILTQALEALEEVPLEARDQSSMTMAIDPELLPEAKAKIRDFRRSLCAFLQENARPKSAVYQLSVSLFPVGGSL